MGKWGKMRNKKWINSQRRKREGQQRVNKELTHFCPVELDSWVTKSSHSWNQLCFMVQCVGAKSTLLITNQWRDNKQQ